VASTSAPQFIEPVVAEGGPRLEVELPAAEFPASGDRAHCFRLAVERAADDRDPLAVDPPKPVATGPPMSP
jgi:hypothetical protein